MIFDDKEWQAREEARRAEFRERHRPPMQMRNRRMQPGESWNDMRDREERHFNKMVKRGGAAFVFVWIAAILGCAAFWGVVIWAIVKLVQNYT